MLASATVIVAPGTLWLAVPVGLPEPDDVTVMVLVDGIDAVVGTVMVVENAPALSGVAEPTVVDP